ncbi:hypothetical protein ACHWQZ_G010528 [Mnemiopsis leidyi]
MSYRLQLDNILTLLLGPKSCGKTSILFNHAVQELLSNSRNKVCFICPRRLEKVPPTLTDLPDDSTSLKNLSFHYLFSRKELRQFLVEQLPKESPDLILIDNLQHYFSDLPDLYLTIKILEHSLNFNRKRQGRQCHVILASQSSSLAPLNQNTLSCLIPGRIVVSPLKVSPKIPGRCFSVQGTEFNLFEDPRGEQNIRELTQL